MISNERLGRNVRIVHLHEIHIHEERLGVLGVLLDVSDSGVGLPNIELMQIVVVDEGDFGRGFACCAFPLVQIDDLLIFVPIGGVEFREPRMGEPIRVAIRVDARIVGGKLLHFIEAMLNRVELGLIAQMPLAREVRAIAVLLEELGDRRRGLRQAVLIAGHNHHREGRTDGDAPGYERGAAGGTTRLTIPTREHGSFLGDAIDVRGRMAKVRAPAIGSEIVPAGVVRHQHDDVRTLRLLGGRRQVCCCQSSDAR